MKKRVIAVKSKFNKFHGSFITRENISKKVLLLLVAILSSKCKVKLYSLNI